MSITVRRSNISVYEDRLEDYYGVQSPLGSWTASFSGSLSTGEYASLSRSGETFADALAKLESAIEENGWKIA